MTIENLAQGSDGLLEMQAALDPVVFANTLGLEPDPWQKDLLRSTSDRALLNCSRQSGKSTMAAALALHHALYTPGSLTLLVAPALRQSTELFSKLFELYNILGEPLKRYGERRLSLDLTNESRIVAVPGSERTVRGFSKVSLLIMDEASRIDDALYYSTRPMLSVSGGRLLMLSTPYGRRGVFFEAFEEGGSEWERFRVTAEECPRISEEFLAEEKRSMPEFWYLQEYFTQFLETEDQIFSYDLVMNAIDDEVKPLQFETEGW